MDQAELRELYQEVIMDHNKRPHNWGSLEGARSAEGHNPLCGDNVTVYTRIADGQVQEVAFMGDGCAISKASASMMTDAVKGRNVQEIEALAEHFHRLVTKEGGEPDEALLGKLRIFAGVAEFPARVKCASLAWHTLKAALKGEDAPVTTE
jgi:nitrogen fixation protein NifU and related proteins